MRLSNRATAAALVVSYLGVIVAANLISAHYGPSASIYNAFFLVGFAITTRDYLHDLWRGHRIRNMGALIVAGSALSYGASIALASDSTPSSIVARIALASCVAFATSESWDALIYQAMHKREWLERSNVSNITSASIDSAVFVSIAFGWTWSIIFGQICAKIAGGFIWSWLIARRREARGERVTEGAPA